MRQNNNAIPHLGGGGDDVDESWSACTADVCISQQTVPHCKTRQMKKEQYGIGYWQKTTN